IRCRGDPRERGVPLVRRDPALRDGPVEVARDPLPAGLGTLEVGLVEDDGLPDRGMDLGDAVAHEAGTRHEDPLDRHPGSVSRSMVAEPPNTNRSATSERPPPAAINAETRNVPPSPTTATAAPRIAGARPNATSTKAVVVPTTAPRSISSTRATASAR